ncbi:hypothetical protein Sa4125_30080 [Aureimonas sp. SA4125]|uniref:hypothetical protein n=1 Tax=Aureimonas sp. SA4125 TaxID=2826993 RepID=UPI001CC64AA0|nr:hypothetical protein [Aureimonas sp. SA4125]BDA85466.1 hypothetical protein Sa4125_30080 [Aureimonas sp. SA4125]
MIDMRTQHATASSLRERILEHSLVADIWRLLWSAGITDVEILRSEFDGYGYDLVIAWGVVVRHVQLKAGRLKNPGNFDIATSLADKPSGCVVYLDVDDALEVRAYWYFGAEPGEPMPSLEGYRPARRIGRTAEGVRPDRKNHVRLRGSGFQRLDGLEQLVERLLGRIDGGGETT